LKDTYDEDYRFLSHVAHCSSRGLLLDKINNVIEIKSDRLIREILVYGTKYALAVTTKWNEHFHLIEQKTLDKLCEDANNFDFRVR